MQPSRKREGKPAGEGAGGTVGMQPSAKAEGKSVGEGGGLVAPAARGVEGWGGCVLTAQSQPCGLLLRGFVSAGREGTAHFRALCALRLR
jgi:hypothetical protein